MKQALTDAMSCISVPANLNETVLTACRAEAASPALSVHVVRWVPVAVSVVACIAVLGVALFAEGNKPPAPPYTGELSTNVNTTTKQTNMSVMENSITTSTEDTSENTTTAQSVATSDTTVKKSTTGTTTTTQISVSTDATVQTTVSTMTSTTKEPSTTVTTTTKPSTTASTTEKLPPSTASTATTATTQHTTTTTTMRTNGSTTANPTRPTTGVGTPSVMGSFHEVASFQEMTVEELETYYGQKAAPTWLPEGLELRLDPSLPLGIYRRNDSLIAVNETTWKRLLGSGMVRDAEVVYDCNRLRWCDFIDGRRELTVSIASAPYPRYQLGDMNRFDDPIIVGGTTLQAAYFEDSASCWCWSVLVVKGDVEYYVQGWNITEAEFIQILESLIG